MSMKPMVRGPYDISIKTRTPIAITKLSNHLRRRYGFVLVAARYHAQNRDFQSREPASRTAIRKIEQTRLDGARICYAQETTSRERGDVRSP